jgi:hypothetical protein
VAFDLRHMRQSPDGNAIETPLQHLSREARVVSVVSVRHRQARRGGRCDEGYSGRAGMRAIGAGVTECGGHLGNRAADSGFAHARGPDEAERFAARQTA